LYPADGVIIAPNFWYSSFRSHGRIFDRYIITINIAKVIYVLLFNVILVFECQIFIETIIEWRRNACKILVWKFLGGCHLEDRETIRLNLETYGMMMGGYESFNN